MVVDSYVGALSGPVVGLSKLPAGLLFSYAPVSSHAGVVGSPPRQARRIRRGGEAKKSERRKSREAVGNPRELSLHPRRIHKYPQGAGRCGPGATWGLGETTRGYGHEGTPR